jgi:hypothetical protein
MVRTICRLGLWVGIVWAPVAPIPSARAGGGPECIAIGVARSRELGPKGLEMAFARLERHQQERERLQRVIADLESEIQSGGDRADSQSATNSDSQKALAEARLQLAAVERWINEMPDVIDQIGAQRGCTVSRLFWYTDLNAAKAEAQRTNRPILSLRMLGKLTDEFSCANSRFFRTALYSNAKVSQFLRDNYVLHWQSVRPVPRVTIDFGDGRKLERTLTGNSAHYVLSADGTPLDVLPGLYSPLAFLQWAWTMRDFELKYDAADAGERAKMLAAFHAAKKDEVLRRWDMDIQYLGDQRAELVATRITPKAVAAARKAFSKSAAEVPMLRFANLGGTWMERGMDDELWQAIAARHREDVKLDETSIAVMRQEFPRAGAAARMAVYKSQVEDPILRVVRAFENSIALDTVRNEYLLHRRIHEAFADHAAQTGDIDALNEWVYAELFLTPSSDPWLGLAAPDVYTALENDGRMEAPEAVLRAGG